ncbi:TatD family hydrolase [Spirochaeta thermophila]|uniref:Hydrolase, TatD family n=1 Tax=Winmispira thermophila (strain ATCC 49972 / DSM 6192 / RI 19.B1) TaxID=665571 RepID=E0RRV3_WINT6|nr:TatD family hydrolase [Spirochaeta thermophila]ADN01740.1 hypothetical protein STHERM_c07890 [Spirochaeta thermophila DSM 6192]
MEYIDSHFHLDIMEGKGVDVATLCRTLPEEGWRGGIHVCTDPRRWREALRYPDLHPRIRLAVGAYPSLCEEDHSLLVSHLKEALSDPAFVAIGEIGLDFFRSYGTKEAQIALFRTQLLLARETGHPVILHLREAFREAISLLDEMPPPPGGIAHCFSGGPEEAEALLERGFYISFAGTLTYPRNHDLRDAARATPLSAILVETDSPYLAPQPVRGTVNHPGTIPHIIEALASLKGLSPEETASHIMSNYQRFLDRVPPPSEPPTLHH